METYAVAVWGSGMDAVFPSSLGYGGSELLRWGWVYRWNLHSMECSMCPIPESGS